MSAQERKAADPDVAELATLAFDKVDAEDLGPVPSLKEWMEDAEADFVIACFAITIVRKSKSELVEMLRREISEFSAFIDALSYLIKRYEGGVKTLEAAQARLFVAASVLAVEP